MFFTKIGSFGQTGVKKPVADRFAEWVEPPTWAELQTMRDGSTVIDGYCTFVEAYSEQTRTFGKFHAPPKIHKKFIFGERNTQQNEQAPRPNGKSGKVKYAKNVLCADADKDTLVKIAMADDDEIMAAAEEYGFDWSMILQILLPLLLALLQKWLSVFEIASLMLFC